MTSRILLLSLLLIVSSLPGCVPDRPQYVKNWEGLRVGMTKSEVTELLGVCGDSTGPMKIDSQIASSQPVADRIVGALVLGLLLDGAYERWHYGEFEFLENMLAPSDKAYVVYFDRAGRVVKWRKPLATEPALPEAARKDRVEVAATYQLKETNRLALTQNAYRAAVAAGSYVYALSRTGRLYVYELPENDKSPAVSKAAATLRRVGDGNDVELIDGHLVFTNHGGLRIFSLADPRHPAQVAAVEPRKGAQSQTLVRDGNRLFVLGRGRISCFDMTDVTNPRLLFEHGSDNDWYAGCVLGNRLYASDIAVANSGADERDRGGGMSVMTIKEDGLKETGFLAIPAPYHLFALDGTHLLACLDAESLSGSGRGPFGRSVVIDVSDPAHPTAGEIEHRRGGRVAAFADYRDAKLLACDGAVFRIRGTRWLTQQVLPVSGSTLDGAPYHGKTNRDLIALPMDHELVVLRLGARD